MAKSEYKIPPMKEVKELAGYTLIVTRGGANSKMVAKHVEEAKTAKIEEVTDYKMAVSKYKNDQFGKKALIMGTEDTLKHFAAKENMELVPVLFIKDDEEGIAFGKKKMTQSDMDAFNTAIKNLAKNDSLKKVGK